jgi:hypothetical protein
MSALCVVLLPLATADDAAAQDEATPIVYGVYLECNPALGQRLSEIVADVWGPMVRQRIDSGDLTAWGMITHATGGPWNRALYQVGTDLARLLGAVDEMVAEWAESSPETLTEFWDACGDHEDYVWRYVTGSAPAEQVAVARPTAGMSTYWVCDEGRGSLVDLIVEEAFASIYDAQVEAGLLNSWSWFSHFVGGEYRRLLVMDGASHEELLTARDNVLEAIGDEHAGLGSEFTNVCNGHTDYLWNIEIAEP